MAGQVGVSPAALAAEVAELVRSLNYATLAGAGRLTYPGDVYDVLGSLKVTAERLPQLCGQLGRFLAAELDAGRVLAVEGQPYAGAPAVAVTAAGLALADAGADAWNLADALASAQQATAGLAHHDQVDDQGDDQVPECSSCGQACVWAEDAWTCTGCGDEWYPDHGSRYAAPDPDGRQS